MIKHRRHKRSGFSLVEVVLAIGIVAFAFIAVMGLIPVGLTVFNRSVNSTVQAQIAQRLFGEAQQVRFEDLSTITDSGRFYDAEGLPVGEGNTPPVGGFIYHAVVNPPTEVFLDNAYVRTVTVDISKNRTVQETRLIAPTEVKRYSFMVANVGT